MAPARLVAREEAAYHGLPAGTVQVALVIGGPRLEQVELGPGFVHAGLDQPGIVVQLVLFRFTGVTF